jgi:uncharacterized protein YjbK
MQSYIITAEIEIERQEGDTGSIVLTVPAVLDPSDYTITFSVKERKGTTIFTKTDTDWIRASQQITCYLAAVDTKGYAGNHEWELQFTSSTEIITVGRGCFKIIKEVIQ